MNYCLMGKCMQSSLIMSQAQKTINGMFYCYGKSNPKLNDFDGFAIRRIVAISHTFQNTANLATICNFLINKLYKRQSQELKWTDSDCLSKCE